MGGKKDDNEQDTEEDEEVMETASTSKSPVKPLAKSPAKSPVKKSPAKGSASKRSRGKDDISEIPVAKKGKKPVCKYGGQTGSEHKEAFPHPSVRYTLSGLPEVC